MGLSVYRCLRRPFSEFLEKGSQLGLADLQVATRPVAVTSSVVLFGQSIVDTFFGDFKMRPLPFTVLGGCKSLVIPTFYWASYGVTISNYGGLLLAVGCYLLALKKPWRCWIGCSCLQGCLVSDSQKWNASFW